MVQTMFGVRGPATGGAVADPWSTMRKDMDQWFERAGAFFGSQTGHRPGGTVSWGAAAVRASLPAVDIVEDDHAFKLYAELPGQSSADVEVSVTDGELTLRGHKRRHSEHQNHHVKVSERRFEAFERVFALPENTDAAKTTAEFAKGVLTVTVPKRQPTARKVEVKPGIEAKPAVEVKVAAAAAPAPAPAARKPPEAKAPEAKVPEAKAAEAPAAEAKPAG